MIGKYYIISQANGVLLMWNAKTKNFRYSSGTCYKSKKSAIMKASEIQTQFGISDLEVRSYEELLHS